MICMSAAVNALLGSLKAIGHERRHRQRVGAVYVSPYVTIAKASNDNMAHPGNPACFERSRVGIACEELSTQHGSEDMHATKADYTKITLR
jgi:Lhr-like helicase